MAANTHVSIASWNLALNAMLDVLNTGGYLELYDSTGTGQPATPNVAVTTQVLLATCNLSATAFGAASGGTKTANAITSGTGLAAGTATWARAYTSGAVAVIDGSVGTSGCDFTMADTSVTIGAVVPATAWTVSMPTAQ
jgi:hypothetical protein